MVRLREASLKQSFCASKRQACPTGASNGILLRGHAEVQVRPAFLMPFIATAFCTAQTDHAAADADPAVPDSIYGVELGPAFSVRPCPPPPHPIVIPAQPAAPSAPATMPTGPPLPSICYNAAVDAAQGRPSRDEYRVIPVHFTGGAPPISAMNSFDVGVQNGIVHEIRIRTKPVSVQDNVMAELRDKFGTPLVDRYETLEKRDPFDYNVDRKFASGGGRNHGCCTLAPMVVRTGEQSNCSRRPALRIDFQ